MNQPAITCHPQESLHHAAYLMDRHGVGSVLAINEDGELAGMITDRDIAMAAYERQAPLRDVLVHEIMSKNLVTCGPDDSTEDVAIKIREHGVRRFPVLGPGRRVIGLISIVDLARHDQRTAAA